MPIDAKIKKTAYHECAHVVIGAIVGIPCHQISMARRPTDHGGEIARGGALLGPSLQEVTLEQYASVLAAGFYIESFYLQAEVYPEAWEASAQDRRLISKEIPALTQNKMPATNETVGFWFGSGHQLCTEHFKQDQVCRALEALCEAVLKNLESDQLSTLADEIYRTIRTHLTLHCRIEEWVNQGCPPLDGIAEVTPSNEI